MPTYEYECPRCANRFELRRSFSDDRPVSCTKCGCDARRIFSPVPIIFKGSGFYVTDSKGSHSHSELAGDKGEAKASSTETDD